MPKNPQKPYIAVTQLAREFGWSVAKLKKTLHSHGICLADRTPSRQWAKEVKPKFVEAKWEKEETPQKTVIMYLWPKKEILQTLKDLGYTPLTRFEKACHVVSWNTTSKTLRVLTGLIKENFPLNEKERFTMDIHHSNGQLKSMHWSTDQKDHLPRVKEEMREVFHSLGNEPIQGTTAGNLLQRIPERASYAIEQLASFLERQKCEDLAWELRGLLHNPI